MKSFVLGILVLLLGGVIFSLHPTKTFAAACSTSTGGNWSTITWSCGHTPTSSDDVTLSAASPYTVTFNVSSATINSLTVTGASSNGSVTFAVGANTLSVTGAVTITGGSTNQRVASVTVSGGTLTAGGNIVFSASNANRAVLDVSGGSGSTVNIGGTIQYSSAGTFTPGTTSIVNYNGAASTLEIGTTTYANLYINGTVSTSVPNAISAANVTGDVRVQSGTLSIGSMVGNAAKTLEVAAGATLQLTGTVTPPLSGFGTYSFATTSTVVYNEGGTSTYAALATTYGNLQFSTPFGAINTFQAGTVTVNGDLTIGDGVGGSTTILDCATNSTTLTVNGNVVINSNGELDANAANTTTVKGNWTNSGTFVHDNGTVAFTGTGAQAINSSTTFFNLQVTGSTTRTVTFTAGTTTTVTASGSLTLSGSSGHLLTLQSSSSSDWGLSVNNTGTTVSVTYVSVSHSDASGGKQIDASDGTSTNGGNNTNWNFGAPTLDHYSIVITTPQTAGVCFTGTNTVTAQDASNATITSDTSTVNMTTSGTSVTFYTDSSCTPGNETTQYTLSSGVANLYIKTTKKQSGITITATRNGFTETGTSGSITINPGSVTRLVITLPGQTFTDGTGNSGSVTGQTAGSSFTMSKISATDDYFNVNTGYSGAKTLAYSGPANAPNGQAPSYTTSVSFTSGQSTTSLTTTLYKAESTTISVTDSGSYGYGSSSITVGVGSAGNYLVSPAGGSQTAGSSFSVTITARDSWNNNLGSSYSPPAGTYTFSTTAATAPDGTSPSLGTLVQGDFTNGVATKTVTLYKAESGVTFTASEPSPSSVTGTSSSVTVSRGSISTSASHSTISLPASAAANSAVTVTITLKDTWNNPVTSYAGTNLSFTGTSPSYILTSPGSTNSSGVTTALLNWSDTGTKTVVVTDSGVGQLSSSPTITITEPVGTTEIQGGVDLNGGVDVH